MKRSRAQYFIYAILLIGVLISSLYLRHFLDQNSLPNFSGLLDGRFWLAMSMAASLQMLANYIRAWKSRLLLGVIRPTKVRTLFKGLSIGFLFNALLPFRLGEFVRAHVVGESMSISRTVVFCTILMERALDGFILGLSALALVLVFRLTHQPLSPAVIYLAMATILVATLVGYILIMLHRQTQWLLRFIHKSTGWLNDLLRDQARLILWSAIYGLNIIIKRARLIFYVLVSLLMWIVYGLSMVWLIVAVLPWLVPLKQIALTIAIYLSVLIPSGPAYLGTFQQSVFQVGHSLISQSNGLLILSLLAWLTLILPISVCGAILLLVNRTRPRRQSRTASAEIMKNKLYRETDISNELSHFLDAYFAGTEINQVLHNYEASSDFRLVRTFKGGSNAITLLGWSSDVLMVKKIILPQYAKKLQAQYAWLAERQGLPHMPKLGDEELTDRYYSIDIGYNEEYVPLFDFIHSEQLERSVAVLDDLLEFVSQSLYRPRPAKNTRTNLESYIDTKVIDKIADAATLNPEVATLLNFKTLNINGQSYDNFTQIMEKIRSNDLVMADLSTYSSTPIHGDLTVDNIIVSQASGDFILLDPNDENLVSDQVVDMGKLYQSLHSGYEFLCQLKSCRVAGNNIQFEESFSSKYSELFAIINKKLKRDLSPEKYRSLSFHEAVHYCRMLTYRAKLNPSTLPVFYAIAVRLFNEFYEQYEPAA